MKTVKTFEAKIYVGFRPGYDGDMYNIELVEKLCKVHCNLIGLCVTVTPTKFMYKGGHEDGAIVGLINYPRFPSSPEEILDNAKQIGYILMKRLEQNRVSIVTTNETIMLESDDECVKAK